MRVTIVKFENPNAVQIAKNIQDQLTKANIQVTEENPDLVISVGGDGTLLSAFHRYQDNLQDIRFVAVHTGHLGFYADWREEEIDQLVNSIKNDNQQKVSYPLVEAKIVFKNQQVQNILALNEIVFTKNSGTLISDVLIESQKFERFRGDGISFSTPTGSTAYNKTIGGAVINPRIKVMQMTEIASINNLIFRTLGSPIIIPAEQNVTLIPDDDRVVINYDNLQILPDEIEKAEIKISESVINFAEYHHIPFWQRVQNSFIGDIDEI